MATGKTKRHLTIRDNKIAQASLQGLSYREIAQKFGITKGRISQILNKESIKEILDTGTSQMVSLVPLAADVFLKDLQIPDDSDAPLRALRNKTADKVLQATAITPGNVTNQTINNIYNQQNNIITPDTMKLVKLMLPGIDEETDRTAQDGLQGGDVVEG